MSPFDAVLTTKNITLYAAQHYTNHQCYDEEEFLDDLARIENLKKLFKRFSNAVIQKRDNKKISKLIRIILNNIIIFNNVFESKAAVRMLFLKIPEYRSEIKTLLIYLNLMPEAIYNLEKESTILYSSDTEINFVLADFLRKL